MRRCILLCAALFLTACANKPDPGTNRWIGCAEALSKAGATNAARIAREVADEHDRKCSDADGPNCSDEILKANLEKRKAEAQAAMKTLPSVPTECSDLG